jgi:hypothetical protein
VLAALPGVIVGAVIRVEFLAGPRAFLLVVACVLGPLGLWLGLGAQSDSRQGEMPRPGAALRLLAFGVGVIGRIHGIGGGSIIAPILITLGYSVVGIAGAALLATFVTSFAGVAPSSCSASIGTAAQPSAPTGRSGSLSASVVSEAATPALVSNLDCPCTRVGATCARASAGSAGSSRSPRDPMESASRKCLIDRLRRGRT